MSARFTSEDLRVLMERRKGQQGTKRATPAQPDAKTEAKATATGDRAMNKTEAAYAAILEAKKMSGEILRYDFEPETFRLADKTTYTPDFRVVRADLGVEFHEVKGGFVREDAWIKLKIAAAWNPYRFFLAQYKRREWKVTRVGQDSS